jgi:hypothetical protein
LPHGKQTEQKREENTQAIISNLCHDPNKSSPAFLLSSLPDVVEYAVDTQHGYQSLCSLTESEISESQIEIQHEAFPFSIPFPFSTPTTEKE